MLKDYAQERVAQFPAGRCDILTPCSESQVKIESLSSWCQRAVAKVETSFLDVELLTSARTRRKGTRGEVRVSLKTSFSPARMENGGWRENGFTEGTGSILLGRWKRRAKEEG